LGKEVIELNKKVLVIAVVLIAVAMLTLSVSAAYAIKPEPTTMTLTGTFYIYPPLAAEWNAFPAGASGNSIWKFRGLPVVWTGGIKAGSLGQPPNPGGYYHGNWVIFNAGTSNPLVSTVGITVLEGASIEGIGTGDLKIFGKDETLRIISGTGDFKGIKGTGTFDKVTGVTYSYELVVQINP
jgi:hypothetical protein